MKLSFTSASNPISLNTKNCSMKTCYTCTQLTTNFSKNFASSIRLFLMLFLFIGGTQFKANAQQGIPAANITGPLTVCVNNTDPQRLDILVASETPITSINFGLHVTSVPVPPDPNAVNAYIDPADTTLVHSLG